MQKRCPRCGSKDVKVVDYLGAKVLVCNKCGYDERVGLEVFPEQRETQREKRRFSPYKAGGRGRAEK